MRSGACNVDHAGLTRSIRNESCNYKFQYCIVPLISLYQVHTHCNVITSRNFDKIITNSSATSFNNKKNRKRSTPSVVFREQLNTFLDNMYLIFY